MVRAINASDGSLIAHGQGARKPLKASLIFFIISIDISILYVESSNHIVKLSFAETYIGPVFRRTGAIP